MIELRFSSKRPPWLRWHSRTASSIDPRKTHWVLIDCSHCSARPITKMRSLNTAHAVILHHEDCTEARHSYRRHPGTAQLKGSPGPLAVGRSGGRRIILCPDRPRIGPWVIETAFRETIGNQFDHDALFNGCAVAIRTV